MNQASLLCVTQMHPEQIRGPRLGASRVRTTELRLEAQPDERAIRADRDTFVQAMRATVSSVTVVTTDGPAGRFGLTVSAFCSVSAEPPMVLVCINNRSPASAAVHENARFRVNVLSTAQRSIAETFAGQPTIGESYEFSIARWDESDGGPALPEAVASFGCLVETVVPSGTHTVFIGRVVAVRAAAAPPLLYTDRAYGHPCTETDTGPPSVRSIAGARSATTSK